HIQNHALADIALDAETPVVRRGIGHSPVSGVERLGAIESGRARQLVKRGIQIERSLEDGRHLHRANSCVVRSDGIDAVRALVEDSEGCAKGRFSITENIPGKAYPWPQLGMLRVEIPAFRVQIDT